MTRPATDHSVPHRQVALLLAAGIGYFVAAGSSYSVMYLVVAVGAVGAAGLLHSPFLAPVSGLRRQPAAAP